MISYTFSVFRFKSYLPHVFLWKTLQPTDFPLWQECMCTPLSHHLWFLIVIIIRRGFHFVNYFLYISSYFQSISASTLLSVFVTLQSGVLFHADFRLSLPVLSHTVLSVLPVGSMSRLWTQKVELFSPYLIARRDVSYAARASSSTCCGVL